MSRGTHEYRAGFRLFTVHVRRGPPDVQDSKLDCILACIQAAKAGADEALMLDPQGFVATCNSVHFFIVRRGEVRTSTGDYCLGGITRGNIIRLCREHAIPVRECNFSLTDVYGAEESFVTGTFAGVAAVDGPSHRRRRARTADGARAVAVPGSRGARVRGVSAGTSTAPAPAPIQPGGSASLRRVRRSPRTAPACRPTSVCPPFRRT